MTTEKEVQLRQLRTCLRQLLAIVEANDEGDPYLGAGRLLLLSQSLTSELNVPSPIAFRIDQEETNAGEPDPEYLGAISVSTRMVILSYPYDNIPSIQCLIGQSVRTQGWREAEGDLLGHARRVTIRALKAWVGIVEEWINEPDVAQISTSNRPEEAVVGPTAGGFQYGAVKIDLTPQQYKIVSFLWNAPNRTASISDLSLHLWDDEAKPDATLRSALARLSNHFLLAEVPVLIGRSDRGHVTLSVTPDPDRCK